MLFNTINNINIISNLHSLDMGKNNNIKKYHDLDNLSHDIYNDIDFAKSYTARIENNAHNALLERPATLSLLPDVQGMKVLDAGCGPGVYTEWLVDNGALVTAVDSSDTMLALTKERVNSSAKLIRANLNEELQFLKDSEFDIVLSSLVVHYLRNWSTAFSEFNRVLKPGGTLVFSTHHPFTDFEFSETGRYFDAELLEVEWPSFSKKVKFFRRPLCDIFDILREADFAIEHMTEPVPLIECQKLYPELYEELSSKPPFICFKATKIK